MPKALCTICEKEFSGKMEDAWKQAEAHEKIPIEEGDYHGMILKENKTKISDQKYLLLSKTGHVSEGHERMYSIWESSINNDEDFYFHSKEFSSYINPNNIQKKIKDQEWTKVNKKELAKINKYLCEVVHFDDALEIKEFKTL